MRHGQTSRNYAKAFFAFVTIGMAAACADTTVAPTTEVAFKAPAAFNRSRSVTTFRVGQSGATQRIGNHTISFPAGAICDPMVSTYGEGEWDKPCAALKRSIVITATMLEDADGQPYIDFQPALRFVPTKEVTLSLRIGRKDDRNLSISYCNAAGNCTDESATDASVVTRRAGDMTLVRRVKHFSGYMISSGLSRACDVAPEGIAEMLCGGGGGNYRRSGYMVASGINSSNGNDREKEKDNDNDNPSGDRRYDH